MNIPEKNLWFFKNLKIHKKFRQYGTYIHKYENNYACTHAHVYMYIFQFIQMDTFEVFPYHDDLLHNTK